MKKTRKAISIILLVGAMLWAAEIFRQSRQTDDGGPPMGALFMAVPSVILLIAAGAAWPSGRKP